MLTACGAVAGILTGLRLAGVIRWPWALVTAPAWIPVAAVLVFLGLELAALGRWGRS
jgi:hypothetical protein